VQKQAQSQTTVTLGSRIKIAGDSLKFAGQFSKRIQLKKARCAKRASQFFAVYFQLKNQIKNTKETNKAK